MPSSYVDSVPGVIHLLESYGPRRIVDVGPGWGKYGLMIREYFPKVQQLDCVEVEQGRKPIQDLIYDEVVISDARVLPSEFWEQYQVAMLIDMIEHMSLEDGHELLWTIQRAKCSVVVSTPKVFVEQEDPDNPYEKHISLWSWEEFAPHLVAGDESTIDSIIYRLPKA